MVIAGIFSLMLFSVNYLESVQSSNEKTILWVFQIFSEVCNEKFLQNQRGLKFLPTLYRMIRTISNHSHSEHIFRKFLSLVECLPHHILDSTGVPLCAFLTLIHCAMVDEQTPFIRADFLHHTKYHCIESPSHIPLTAITILFIPESHFLKVFKRLWMVHIDFNLGFVIDIVSLLKERANLRESDEVDQRTIKFSSDSITPLALAIKLQLWKIAKLLLKSGVSHIMVR